MKISLDNKYFQFKESLLPCLVIGAHKSGASYFSVRLIGDLIQQGSKVIFFTAYPMAKDELYRQIGENSIFEVNNNTDIENIPDDISIVIQSGNKDLWDRVMSSLTDIEKYVIFVKNIEEYDKSILDTIEKNKKVILSGSIDDCKFRDEIVNIRWESKIFFTKPKYVFDISLPELKKYESYLASNNLEGILRLKS